MIIARILGTVVSSQKDERLLGKKLLIVKPINLDGTDQSGYIVSVDTVGAGYNEKVIVVSGSSARMADDQWPVLQSWIVALLDGGVEGVAIDVGDAQRADLGVGDKPSGTQWYDARKIDSVNSRKVFYDIDTAGGQSGSAVYRIVNGNRYAFAVHAYGGASTNSGTRIVTPVFNNFVAWKA